MAPGDAKETVVSQTLDSGRNSLVSVGWLLTAELENVHSRCLNPVGLLPGGPCAFLGRTAQPPHRMESYTMKRIALVAAALVLAACSAKEEAPAVDSAAAAPAAAAPAMDSAAMAAPAMDSAAMAAPAADTTKKM